MDDLTGLSRLELEDLCRGLRRNVIALKAQARRDFEEIDWLGSQVRVYRRLAEKLLAEQTEGKETRRGPDA